MATARGQHRLDHRQARPVNRGVAVCRNPWVIQRVKDQRRPRDAGDEMLGGIAFVIVAGAPVAEARRDEAIVEFIDGPDSGDGGSLGGADCGARRQRLAFHRTEHVALIEEVAAGDHPGGGRRQIDRGGHRDAGQHRKPVAAFTHKFQHEIAAQRISEQDDPVPCEIRRQAAQSLRQIPGAPRMVMPCSGWPRRAGAAQVYAQDRPAQADKMARRRHRIPARLRAGEAMHQHHQRLGDTAGRPVEPSRKPVAFGYRQRQPLTARQVRRPAAHDIAQSLEVAPKPGGPFPEWRDCPGRQEIRRVAGLRNGENTSGSTVNIDSSKRVKAPKKPLPRSCITENELCPLASAIDAGNVELPPYIGQLIQNAPDSFIDTRAGQIASIIRTMRQSGEPVTFETVARKQLPLITFIGTELNNAALPLESAEYYAAQCWQVFQARRAMRISLELQQRLNDSPEQAIAAITDARAALDSVSGETTGGLPELIDAAGFIAKPINPPAELIAGILHQGSKLVFGGGSKSYKSWTLLDLSVSIATGTDWLGHATMQGRVLFVNFEIQAHAWQGRLRAIAKAKGVTLQAGQITLWNLRGHAADFRQLIPSIIERCRRENFALIVLDPIYKLYGNTDENSAGNVALLLNSLEHLATTTGAAIAFGAHFAKGNASGKEAIDRISGSGVFARDPDSLLIFTKHQEDDVYVIEAILRNFPPIAPLGVRWQFPLMVRDEEIDPAKLKKAVGTGGRKKEHTADELLKLLPADGLTNAAWLASAEKNKISRRTFYRLKRELDEAGKLHPDKTGDLIQPKASSAKMPE